MFWLKERKKEANERERERSTYTQLITYGVVYVWFEALRTISHHQKRKKPNHKGKGERERQNITLLVKFSFKKKKYTAVEEEERYVLFNHLIRYAKESDR